MTTKPKAIKVSPEVNDLRARFGKALFIAEKQDELPRDPEALQAAFDAEKTDWMRKAIKVQTLLSRLGYEVVKATGAR